ncbi:MAG: prenyltransferase [Planctomycetota bacterium]|nr:MAG: prenyltransferase [Planctomycetota bacterium]
MNERSIAAALLGAVLPWASQAQDRREEPREVYRKPVEVTPEAQRAIERGLRFLSTRQERRGEYKGAYQDGIGRKVNHRYLAHQGYHVGVTGLVGMAFLSNGSTPGRGPYGEQVQGCVDFILRTIKPNGFATHDHSRMYSHAFATLFMAEVYGMAPSARVRKGLRRMVDLIVSSQNEQGGWRYMPAAKDSDLSITVCQVQALRAARNVGVRVPKETIDAAIRYVKRSYIRQSTSFQHVPGGFWYQVYENFPLRPSRTSFALTAAGVTALYGAGVYEGPEIRGGLRYLFDPRNRPAPSGMRQTFDYFYGHYYAIQAFFQAGDAGPVPYWSRWYPRIRDELVAGQFADGRWQDLVGPNYATAMACIILQIPYRYLPIFER